MYFTVKEWKINFASSTMPWDWQGDIVCIDKEKEVQIVLEKMQYFKISNFTTDSIKFSEEFINDVEEVNYIESTLEKNRKRFENLREIWDLRSIKEEQEFQTMSTKKTELLERRRILLN